jgi:hypothetical protein
MHTQPAPAIRPLAPRRIPAQYRAPPRRVHAHTVLLLMYQAMERCIALRKQGHEISSAHAHTGAAVVTTRRPRA